MLVYYEYKTIQINLYKTKISGTEKKNTLVLTTYPRDYSEHLNT